MKRTKRRAAAADGGRRSGEKATGVEHGEEVEVEVEARSGFCGWRDSPPPKPRPTNGRKKDDRKGEMGMGTAAATAATELLLWAAVEEERV